MWVPRGKMGFFTHIALNPEGKGGRYVRESTAENNDNTIRSPPGTRQYDKGWSSAVQYPTFRGICVRSSQQTDTFTYQAAPVRVPPEETSSAITKLQDRDNASETEGFGIFTRKKLQLQVFYKTKSRYHTINNDFGAYTYACCLRVANCIFQSKCFVARMRSRWRLPHLPLGDEGRDFLGKPLPLQSVACQHLHHLTSTSIRSSISILRSIASMSASTSITSSNSTEATAAATAAAEATPPPSPPLSSPSALPLPSSSCNPHKQKKRYIQLDNLQKKKRVSRGTGKMYIVVETPKERNQRSYNKDERNLQRSEAELTFCYRCCSHLSERIFSYCCCCGSDTSPL